MIYTTVDSVLSASAFCDHACERWVEPVLSVANNPRDVTTVDNWCRLVALSRTMLGERCRAICASPKRSLDLARVLRFAIVARRQHAMHPQSILDVADRRTAARLLHRGGISLEEATAPGFSVALVLTRQKYVDSAGAIHALSRCLGIVRPGADGTGATSADRAQQLTAGERTAVP